MLLILNVIKRVIHLNVFNNIVMKNFILCGENQKILFSKQKNNVTRQTEIRFPKKKQSRNGTKNHCLKHIKISSKILKNTLRLKK